MRKIQNSFPDLSQCTLHVSLSLISFQGNSDFHIVYKAWFLHATRKSFALKEGHVKVLPRLKLICLELNLLRLTQYDSQ